MAATAPLTLTTPIQYAKGVGDARAAELLKLGIRSLSVPPPLVPRVKEAIRQIALGGL